MGAQVSTWSSEFSQESRGRQANYWTLKSYHHNVFERHHRFIGWLGLATTWCFVVMGNAYDIKHGEWRSDANSLLSVQEFWFAVFMTIL